MQHLSRGLLGAVPPFQPRAPWWTGDLQTLRNALLPVQHSPALDRVELIDIGPAGHLRLSVTEGSDPAKPGVLLIHGLGGCEDSAYLKFTGQVLARAGHCVARLNLRAAGPGLATSRGPYHAGLTEDLRAALRHLKAHAPRWVLMGFSLGGHMSLKLAAEPNVPDALAAVIAVSAPLDLANTADRVMAARNIVYHKRIVATMRRYAAAWLPADEQDRLKRIKTVRDFDTEIVASAFGFHDADDYYAQMSVKPHLDALSVPALILHAVDDPWIPFQDYHRPWGAQAPLDVLLTRRGGHVGFHGRASQDPYYARLAETFLARI